MKSIELRNSWSGIVAEAKQIYNKAQSENREPTDSETARFDDLMGQADQLKVKIAQAERGEKLEMAEAELRSVSPRKFAPNGLENRSKADQITDQDRKEAFRAWALGNKASESQAYKARQLGIDCRSETLNLRALSVGTGSAGGYTVPVTLGKELDVQLKCFCPMRNCVRVFETNGGGEFDWPTFNDVSNSGAIVADAGAPATNVDPSFGKNQFYSVAYSSDIVKVSLELLEDSIIDVQAVLTEALGVRIARKQANDFMLGTSGGSTSSIGLSTVGTTGVTLASSNPITFAQLKNLEHALDIDYRRRPDTAFVMHDTVFQQIEVLVDSNGRPLFLLYNEGLSNATVYKLFGYPVYISNDMVSYSTATSRSPAIIFGPMKEFGIRDIANSVEIVRYNELYRGNRQIGFSAEMRSYSNLIGPSTAFQNCVYH